MGTRSRRTTAFLKLAVTFLLLAFATLLVNVTVECRNAGVVEGRIQDIRAAAVAVSLNHAAGAAVDRLLEIPDVTGVEAFTREGRRIAQSTAMRYSGRPAILEPISAWRCVSIPGACSFFLTGWHFHWG